MMSENFKMLYKNIFLMKNVTDFQETVESGMDLHLVVSQWQLHMQI